MRLSKKAARDIAMQVNSIIVSIQCRKSALDNGNMDAFNVWLRSDDEASRLLFERYGITIIGSCVDDGKAHRP